MWGIEYVQVPADESAANNNDADACAVDGSQTDDIKNDNTQGN